MIRGIWFGVIALALCLSGAAQEPSYPTAIAIESTTLPTADRYALAQRFLVSDDAFALPDVNASIGDQHPFTVVNTATNRSTTIDAQLHATSDYAFLWVEAGLGIDASATQGFLTIFDQQVATPAYALWSEDTPANETEKVALLFATQLNPNVLGYFPSDHDNLLVFNADRLSPNPAALSVAAHELQHLIHFRADPDEAAWLNEGFSMLTEHVLGWRDHRRALNAFFRAPSTQLTSFGIGPSLNADYGAALSWTLYLYERFGEEILRIIAADATNGMASIAAALANHGLPPIEVVYADWVLANGLRDFANGYGYTSLPDGLEPTPLTRTIASYPITLERTLEQYGSDYYRLDNLPETLVLELTMLPEALLLPTPANSGNWVWYSQRGDNINPRLTRHFDLRSVEAATLSWRVWYDLERDWDYGYISVSLDDGQTWQFQSTPLTTTDNPTRRNLGVGYTGRSNSWQTDHLSLDAFAGQEILVRFEMVTDGAVNRAGIALDDVHLDVLGYESDFEDDGGGWLSEGWVRSDNRIPQHLWLQVVQHQADGVQVSRWLEANSATHHLAIHPQTTHVTLAISPFAIMTTEPMQYRVMLR